MQLFATTGSAAQHRGWNHPIIVQLTPVDTLSKLRGRCIS